MGVRRELTFNSKLTPQIHPNDIGKKGIWTKGSIGNFGI